MAASQIVPQVVPFPQSVPTSTQVTQLELIAFLSLKNRLTQLEEQVDRAEECIAARLQAGAAVEPGVHTAEVKECSGEMGFIDRVAQARHSLRKPRKALPVAVEEQAK